MPVDSSGPALTIDTVSLRLYSPGPQAAARGGQSATDDDLSQRSPTQRVLIEDEKEYNQIGQQ
jgi:hypothetical protein